jgi:hypothetical protein
MKKFLVALGVAALSTGAMAQSVSYIDISSAHNGRLQNSPLDGISLPTNVSFVGQGDVQFKVDGPGNNYWNALHVPGSSPEIGGGGPASVEFSINAYGVTSAYSLINTYWGNANPVAQASIEFFGTNGAYYKKDLIGNVDIRDYNQNIFTNVINGTTTVNAYTYNSFGGGQRMDMQQYELPNVFSTQTLTKIKVTDQRIAQHILLSGLAVRGLNPGNNAVPEPSEWAAMGLLGTGLLGLVVRGRKKKLAN